MSLFNKKLLFINVAATTKYPRFDNGRITRRGLMRVRDGKSYSRARIIFVLVFGQLAPWA